MMNKLFVFILIMLAQAALFSQDKPAPAENSPVKKLTHLPSQPVPTDVFSVRYMTFNKKIELTGKGDLLQVEFQIDNNTDFDRNLYVFVIATIENIVWRYNSFETKKLKVEAVEMPYFVPYPDNLSLYEYEDEGKKEFRKMPKDVKAGIVQDTGQPYKLNRNLVIRTTHLCKYRKNYKYFNHVTILIFDDQEELMFSQVYSIDGRRK